MAVLQTMSIMLTHKIDSIDDKSRFEPFPNRSYRLGSPQSSPIVRRRMSELRPPSFTIPPFVRDDDLRQSIELLFFAYRDFTGEADQMLVAVGFGRAHHRAVYFIGRNPGIPVGGLLRILKITKQSLSRVLRELIDGGYVSQDTG